MYIESKNGEIPRFSKESEITPDFPRLCLEYRGKSDVD